MLTQSKSRTLLVVAAALINPHGEVLLAQRPPGKMLAGKWEFPGGKVEADESPEAALVRELREELGIETNQSDFEPFWFLSHDYPQFHLLMPVYLCRAWRNQPQAHEHTAITWCHPRDMHTLDMIEADAELVERLAKLYAA